MTKESPSRAYRLPRLRPYQIEAARAVLSSVSERAGRTITIEIARQGGKNELSAQLEMLLMSMAQRRRAEAVKCAPTMRPQARLSMRRLWLRLRQASAGRRARMQADSITLNDARITFLSAEPYANIVGHTASLLLEVDEAQDVDVETFDRDLRPMAATTNATTVLYGTAWDDRTLLERTRQANIAAERRDGVRRHFAYDWEVVAAHVPDYARHVERERERLGATHPAFLTQYCLQTISGGGRLLSAAQRAQLQGGHERLRAPVAGERYAAGLDIAGGDDAEVARTWRDATVLTIGRIVPAASDALVQEPRVEIVEQIAWTGEPHERLLPRLADLLGDTWRVASLAVDATGLGETIARVLSQRLTAARVEGLKFSVESKSRLGFDLLAAINGGRLKLYRADGSPEHRACSGECEMARVAYRANRTMNFFVDPADGHDDYVMSMALLVRASLDAAPRRARGRLREDGVMPLRLIVA
jgi:hypothetical protein